MTKKKRFEKMCRESLISENLVKDFLTKKFMLQFHLVPHQEQIALSHSGLHVPDILCVEKPGVAFEVKEDKMSAKTGNLAFELSGLSRLRRWGWGEGIKNIYLMYINHNDYRLDVFDLGMHLARLELELKALSDRNPSCKCIPGGDQLHPLYVVPIPLARKLESCITTLFFDEVDLFFFSKSAKAVLRK